jgi:two-component system response regulator HydG
VDCGSISPSLAQSAFFGHVKGAFTGADTNKVGYFQEANGGTLFLDEVGNLPYEIQQMLLRVIQERKYRPVGAKEDKNCNVRIVAATNEDLVKAVIDKRFRQDLLYRLQDFKIMLPPLRNCQEDIMPLAEFFREQSNKKLDKAVKGFDSSAKKALQLHPWSGNVRELKQKIQTAVLLCEGNNITEDDLELYVEQETSPVCYSLKDVQQEKERIKQALEQCDGNKVSAAKLLKIGRTTLYAKMKEYGLN